MRIVPVGHAVSLFLAITFTLTAVLALLHHGGMAAGAPNGGDAVMNHTALMDGMGHRGPVGFLIGFAVSYALGWYAALVFVPLYNFFNGSKAA
ncbi:MAG: hypothetical protein ACOZAA_05240 [Pseudomonadota bacterium]